MSSRTNLRGNWVLVLIVLGVAGLLIWHQSSNWEDDRVSPNDGPSIIPQTRGVPSTERRPPDVAEQSLQSDDVRIRELFRQSRPRSFKEWIALIHSLKEDSLSQEDFQDLLLFLRNEKPVQDLSTSRWHVIVNELLEILRRHEPPTQEFQSTLISLYKTSNDPVLRDYAIQHLRAFLAEQPRLPLSEQNKVAAILSDAVERNEPLAGTALLAWRTIAKSEGEERNFRDHALRLALSTGTNKWTRITALQVCAQRGYDEALDTARSLITDAHTDPSIRMSAIAAVGQLGTEADLKNLTAESEKSNRDRFQAAISKAIATLERRYPVPNS